jgi:hypothetical protein
VSIPVQVALQPSAAVVLPSSQVSLGCSLLSPHLKQPLLATGQLQPASSLHVAEQPSLLAALPSSQASVLSLMPLPHFSQAWPATGQA